MIQKVLLAAGCFWGVQFYYDEVPGITRTTVGYSGGHTENPTYEDVCSHTTGHAEAVLVEFDVDIISLEVLLMHFFRMHNPTTLNRDGPNIGESYRSAIFYFDDEQKDVANKVLKQCQQNFKDPIVTEITKASQFYEAEPYHQKFTERTGIGACHVSYSEIK